MILLRICLYLLCIISISWSVVVFGGPPIIKRLILVYSDGAIKPSGVEVTPTLDLTISRLDFIFQNELTGRPIEGFSRAVKIDWSIFGENQFIKASFGPSVLKDHAVANNISLHTPPFREINWQNVFLVANVGGLVLNSIGKIEALHLKGNLSSGYSRISNVSIKANSLSDLAESSIYSAKLATGEVSELSLNAPIFEQFFSGTLNIKDLNLYEPRINISKTNLQVLIADNDKRFDIDLDDIAVLNYDGFIENIKVDGNLGERNFLQKINLDFSNGKLLNNTPSFSGISASINKSGDQTYNAHMFANLDNFEISNSEGFLGYLPPSRVEVKLELDTGMSKMDMQSKINLPTLEVADIYGSAELDFTSDQLKYMECALMDCALSDLHFAYNIQVDEEWIRGGAVCRQEVCSLSKINHLVRTSDTAKVFTTLNKTKLLSPLFTVYLYGLITSGKKINGGHELIF